ncbi:excinuclease ABC subunit A [Chachezhania sediminis]|uniref:excinuclease ABC subunit A n=1 Tax=Chachezhania sediminis TaxID=2599291 RepID=UPI00131BB5A5|nr:excinuclease ABC subunit A [Chachezhania sediminis]
MFRILGAAALGLATIAMPLSAVAGPQGCPPGLAKKSASCTPPGHAKKSHPRYDDRTYDRGHIDSRYERLYNPDRYGLDPGYVYYTQNGTVYRVDNQTNQILAVIGALSTLLN